MSICVGINGMGRIGRAVLRGVIERDDTAVEVVAVNDLTPVATLAHQLRYDSTYGRWPVDVEADSEHLTVGGRLCGSSASPIRRRWTGVSRSCVLDSGLTIARGDLVKVFGWYDNE